MNTVDDKRHLARPPCPDCRALEGAPTSTSPHAALLLHSDVDINFGGTARGVLQFYVCHTCGKQWEREVARSEPDSVWQASSRQLD